MNQDSTSQRLDASGLLDHLGQTGSESSFAPMISAIGSVASPSLDEEDEFEHYDWVLIRKKGIELGFADHAYFDGRPKAFWRKDGLALVQITLYGDSRDGVAPFVGTLPYGLHMSDARASVREKMAAYQSSLRSYVTDRWDIDSRRLIVSYRPDEQGLDNVHVKLCAKPLDESLRIQPNLPSMAWKEFFGLTPDDSRLEQALSPLDLKAGIDGGEDEREVDFIAECGLEIYFEEAGRLRLPLDGAPLGQTELVFGAVKFHRARDLEARGYSGTLPFDLDFDDNPADLERKVGFAPNRRNDGKLTGHALWHLNDCSLQVLYSVVENHLFRITLMAPGYWQDLDEID